jgi:hypothetical protein
MCGYRFVCALPSEFGQCHVSLSCVFQLPRLFQADEPCVRYSSPGRCKQSPTERIPLSESLQIEQNPLLLTYAGIQLAAAMSLAVPIAIQKRAHFVLYSAIVGEMIKSFSTPMNSSELTESP